MRDDARGRDGGPADGVGGLPSALRDVQREGLRLPVAPDDDGDFVAGGERSEDGLVIGKVSNDVGPDLDDLVAGAHAADIGGAAGENLEQEEAGSILGIEVGQYAEAEQIIARRGAGRMLGGECEVLRGAFLREFIGNGPVAGDGGEGEVGRASGELSRDRSEHAADTGAAGSIDPLPIVVGVVVLRVEAGVDEQRGDAVGVEGIVVAVSGEGQGKQRGDIECCGGLVDQVSQAGSCVGAEDDQFVVFRSAHHIEVDHGPYLLARDDGVANEVPASEQTDFLSVEGDEEHIA